MVWHAYMLNPRAYLEDCLREKRMSLWHTPLPWQPVTDCISNDTFDYEPDSSAKEVFESVAGVSWQNLADPMAFAIPCPSCKSENPVSWTTRRKDEEMLSKANSERFNLKSPSAIVEEWLGSGHGFADSGFTVHCRCGITIDHDSLRAGKFIEDAKLLLRRDAPMPGTVLGTDGIPTRVYSATGVQDPTCKCRMQFPNGLLKAGLYARISSIQGLSMAAIRAEIQEAMKDKDLVKEASKTICGTAGSRVMRTERVAIRKMMSRYWDNSSPFALDLVGAVIRQGTFIEKMHNIDWLHSPALPSTMSRLLVKYTRFFEILKNPLKMAVPTLDVDLAWHTHQLSPRSYLLYAVKQTRTFVDHDDKVAEVRLNDSFAWTSKTYQKMFGEPYSECTCWYCEAVRESHTSTASRLFKSKDATAADSLHMVSLDPKKSVHISAHNAVRPSSELDSYNIVAKKKAEDLEACFQKACARARKKRKPEPKRNDFYYSDAWGYPVYMPAYAPYYAMGYPYYYTPALYPVTPGCMAMAPGAYGNCAAGTCGAGVAGKYILVQSRKSLTEIAGACGGTNGGAVCAGGVGGVAGGAACGGGLGGGCGGGGGAGGCGGGGGGGGCGGECSFAIVDTTDRC